MIWHRRGTPAGLDSNRLDSVAPTGNLLVLDWPLAKCLRRTIYASVTRWMVRRARCSQLGVDGTERADLGQGLDPALVQLTSARATKEDLG
jgi:hypothetical protein